MKWGMFNKILMLYKLYVIQVSYFFYLTLNVTKWTLNFQVCTFIDEMVSPHTLYEYMVKARAGGLESKPSKASELCSIERNIDMSSEEVPSDHVYTRLCPQTAPVEHVVEVCSKCSDDNLQNMQKELQDLLVQWMLVVCRLLCSTSTCPQLLT